MKTRKQILPAAARIIKNEIKQIDFSRESYPSTRNIESVVDNMEYLLHSFRLLLINFLCRKIAPLQVGLHRQLESRFLIDSLYSHGFCASYDEVLRYERCDAIHHGTNIPCKALLGTSTFRLILSYFFNGSFFSYSQKISKMRFRMS